MAKKNYVLDTSVCLTDADVLFKFDNHDIFLPLKVLEEIDGHKKRQDSVGSNARKIIRTLDELRAKGSLEKGIRIDKGKGILKVVSFTDLKQVIFPPDLDLRHPDHLIIATAKTLQANSENRKTILVSRDINMRVICDSIGIPAEDYTSEKAVTSPVTTKAPSWVNRIFSTASASVATLNTISVLFAVAEKAASASASIAPPKK